MTDIKKESLKLHALHKGKIEVVSKVNVKTPEDLSLAYSPGVAEPCLHIARDKELAYKYTSKGNMVAVITDGTAVLGLGDIGPEAALPVMEGKAILLKEFAGVDAFPLCLDTKDPDEIIETVKRLAPSFGGINLEDISAPKCVYIERELQKHLNIPVFHDDQHGTAIVVTAALINSCRLTKRKIEDLIVVLSGTGAAGSSVARMLKQAGVKKLYAYNKDGVVLKKDYASFDFLVKELVDDTIIDYPSEEKTTLESIVANSDVFVGVSAANILSPTMVSTMNKNPIIFAMANPTPEIMPDEALKAGAYIVGTGRSDFPNQINNVLAFPGLFRGALDSNSRVINEAMKMEAANAIALIISDDELTRDYIIPSPFDTRVVPAVSEAVKKIVKELNLQR